MKRAALASTALALSLTFLPGCIVGKIHDEMVSINSRLENVEGQLDGLQKTNDSIDDAIARMKKSNEHLDNVNTRLEMLASIDESLKKLDVHLASLRETINNIDSTIPFLSISGDSKEEKEELEEANDNASPEGDDGGGTNQDPG